MMQLLPALILLAGSSGPSVEACAVTGPPTPPFTPPAPYSAAVDDAAFLYGSPELWVRLSRRALPQREKIFWWRPGFDGSREPRPSMTIAIRALASNVTTIVDRPATNAYFGGAWSILTMIDFPAEGCWEVTGTYEGHVLRFVVNVERQPADR